MGSERLEGGANIWERGQGEGRRRGDIKRRHALGWRETLDTSIIADSGDPRQSCPIGRTDRIPFSTSGPPPRDGEGLSTN